MKLPNTIKNNEIFRGIILGLLSLFILEFGTLAVMAGFATERRWHFEDYQYVLLTSINFIVAGLLGISIAKKMRLLKNLAYILNLVIFIVILAGYAFFVWIRLHYV